MAATDYGDGGALQQLGIAAQEQQRGRGNAFGQCGGKIGIAGEHQVATVLLLPIQCGIGGGSCFAAVVPVFGSLFAVPSDLGDCIGGGGQGCGRAAVLCEQAGETLCADVWRESELYP